MVSPTVVKLFLHWVFSLLSPGNVGKPPNMDSTREMRIIIESYLIGFLRGLNELIYAKRLR